MDDKWFEANQQKIDSILGVSAEEREFYKYLSQNSKEMEEKETFLIDPESELSDDISIPPLKSPGIPLAESNSQVYTPQIMTWEELVNQPDEKQEWIIDGILRPGWLAVLGGHGKQGKTTLAIHLLNALSQGNQFINTTLAVPAIHLNFEMGDNDIRDLIRTVSFDSTLRDNAKIINQITAPLNFDWLEQLLLKEDLPGVCVIDSFRAAFMLPGDSENQSGTVGGILRRLQTIARKTRWSIIIIHHFRKSGTGGALDLAGSGEWLSAPDVVYTWSCSNPNQPGTLGVTGRVEPTEPLSIRLTREKIEFLGTTTVQSVDLERQKIRDTLTKDPQTSDEIAFIVGLPASTVRRRLEELCNSGVVKFLGEGKKGNPRTWQIIEENKENRA